MAARVMSEISFEQSDQLRELLFTMVESLPGGLLLADRQGGILAVNQKARALLGLVGSSVQRRPVWEVLAQHLHLPPATVAPLRLSRGRVVCEAFGRRETERRHLAIARHELRSPFARISGFFLVIDDITHLTMMEARLDRQKRFAAMQEMAIRMSQELKNPLGSLELYASVLKRELQDDPDNQRLAVRMIHAVRTMDYLLNNYGTFAALPEPRFAAVSIRDWLEETVAELQVLGAAKEKGIRFRCDYQHRQPMITADSGLLRQLALNLGLNGLESMPQGGEIRLTTRSQPALEEHPEHPEFLEIRFSDQGTGIAQENLQAIFDPFFTTKDRANGLGLSIAHYIIEVHAGYLQVESRPGQGSVFTVLLPVRELPDPEMAGP